MNSDRLFYAEAHQRPRLNVVAQAALMVAVSFIAASGAHAATTYLPPCNNCTLSSGPAAGDEWVVQGKAVQTIGSFGIDGTLTNQAKVLTNQATLTIRAQAKLVNQKSLVNNNVISLEHPSAQLINQATFQNNGSIRQWVGLIDNVSGHFVNDGTIQVGDRLRNRLGAQLTNNGDVDLGQGGRLDNDLGAVLLNSGNVHGYIDAQVTNNGTIRNLAGGTLSPAILINAGKITNVAGATMSQRVFRSQAGSTLVNHGVINNDRDGIFTLAAGSQYDFTGGTLNNGWLSQLELRRDFTFGDAKGGTVTLGAYGSAYNYAHVRVAQNYTQNTAGSFSNYGQFTNQGTFTVEGMGRFTNAQGATVTNNGAFVVFDEGATNSGSFVNKGSLTLARNSFANGAGATLDNRGSITLGAGKLTNAGTFKNTGTMVLDSGNGYDFTGGTLINGQNGVLTLDTAFALGDAKSGTIVLGKGGELRVQSTLTNRADHLQINSGKISVGYAPIINEKGATFVNNGTVSTVGYLTQAGTWIGSGTFEQQEGRMDLTGVMVQDKVKFGYSGTKNITQGGVLTTKQLDTGMALIHLDGGTINSVNDTHIYALTVDGDGGLINANVHTYERLRVANSHFIVNGNMALDGFMEQTGNKSLSSFGDLTVGTSAYIQAEGNILVSGNFINHSTSALWNTSAASLTLLGQGKHTMALAGQDFGAVSTTLAARNLASQDLRASGPGLTAGNFAWNDIVFGEGGEWALTDGNDTVGAALYTRHLSFLGGLEQIKDLSGDYNIYYDPTAAGNEIFEGKTYAFGSGTGKVSAFSAVPEPGALTLCVAGIAGLAWGRRSHPRRSQPSA